jgi:hypothetical protein
VAARAPRTPRHRSQDLEFVNARPQEVCLTTMYIS